MLPNPESKLFETCLHYLRLLRRLLFLVPRVIEQNTPSTRSFVCRLLILCTYRFPSFRRMLLEDMEELIPSRYHMDVDMVDLVVFRTSDSSVCNKYEDYMAHCNVSNDYAPGDISPLYYSSVSTVAEGNDRPSISRNSPFPHSKSRENLSAMGELSIPPPYVLRPLVECMDIDEEDGISKDAVDARKAFRKKNAHGSKMAADAADDDNPFSTSSTSSLLKKSLKNCIEEESSLNFRFPSLCVTPFIELSRFIRSRGKEKAYRRFVKRNPDFFLWGEIESILGDDALQELPMEWTNQWGFWECVKSSFMDTHCLLHQYLSCFIDFAEEFTAKEPNKGVCWTVVSEIRTILGGHSGVIHVSATVLHGVPVRHRPALLQVHHDEERRGLLLLPELRQGVHVVIHQSLEV